MYGEGEGKSHSQCSLLSHENKRYTINIPELHGATYLASYKGWLLLFRHGSLFFFSPFSRATIELPSCPFAEATTEHVAVLSSAPTSQDCTVVVNRISDSELELFRVCRGENQWVRFKHSLLAIRFSIVRAALFHGGEEFHFLDGDDKLVTFNASKTKQWEEYRLSYDKPAKDAFKLHYTLRKNHFQLQDNKRKLGLFLEANVSISTCGTVIPHAGGELDMLIQSESMPATQPESRHHRNGVWIQPRYFYVPPAQKW